MQNGREPPNRYRVLLPGYIFRAFISRELFRILNADTVKENMGSQGRDMVL